MNDNEQILQTLQAIERNQQTQLELQQQALRVQAEQFEMARKQFDRAEKLQDRAEKIQNSGAAIMGMARKALIVVLPIIIFLIAYLSWLIFR